MNQRIKKKWVKALRSGKYKQGKGRLKNRDKFCCLGVLSDIYLKEIKGQWGVEIPEHQELLTSQVVKWSELYSVSPRVEIVATSRTLSSLNDYVKGYGFKRIANLIEAQL